MKLVMIESEGASSAGLVFGEEVLSFARAASILPSAGTVPATVEAIVDERTGALAAARQVVSDLEEADAALLERLRDATALAPASAVSLGAPLPRPHSVFAHGRAYHSHVQDFEPDAPREKPRHPPAGFSKAVNSIIGPNDAIRIPAAAPDFIDFEGELCIVFGKECHNVSRDEAMDYVAGYTIINDVSARDWGSHPEIDLFLRSALNTMYKNFPTFCPMGPNVTTIDEIPDYRQLHLVTRLNGDVMQEASLGDLIWDLPELIESYSSIIRFMPGDVMSTGTPGGVGAGRKPPVFMKDGDVVSVSVEGIGELTNRVVGP